MDLPIADLLKTGLAGVAGAWLSHRYWVRRARFEMRQTHDSELGRQRFEAFSAIWLRLEPFALYSPPGNVTVDDVDDLGKTLRAWYFRSAGLIMTSSLRDVYFRLQEGLEVVREKLKGAEAILRKREDHFTDTDVAEARRRLRLPPLSESILRSPALLAHWKKVVSAQTKQIDTSAALPPRDLFLFVQALISAFRTAMAQTLDSRSQSLLLAARRE